MSLEGVELGDYRLGEELGRGGMGAVFRAESIRDGPAGPPGAEVAVKVFHPELAEDERAFARFRLEAEIGKEIRHDNLVRTFGIGSGDVDTRTYHFMVMEVVEGRTLKSLLAELGTFPEHLLFLVSDQVLSALAEIHARGVVHRDLKPENIIITPDRRVLLMDLGVARRESGAALTHAGEFVGSLAYAPPEQFTGGETAARTDIYAFGVTLYELATGRTPYGDANLSEILRCKLQEEIAPPRNEHPDLDPFWDQVIHTCVQKEPANRFVSAEELRGILTDGERSAWWLARKGARVIPTAERALKRLRLDRAAPLVGRARDLETLAEFQRRMLPEGGTMFMCGPMGVGKSRLLFEYLESIATADGPLVAAGRCVGTGGRSYEPFIEILTDLLQTDADDAAGLRARLLEVLTPMPAVAENLAAFLTGQLQLGDDFPKDALHAAVANVVRILATERSCIVAIEDLHFAGPETLELFEYVHRALESFEVALVTTVAEDEIEQGSPAHEAVTRVGADPRAMRMQLALLDADAIEELVYQATASERTARTIARPLYDRSDGSPLIVLEMVNHLRTTGQLVEKARALEFIGSIDELAVPSSVSDLAGLKLARLDEDQRETLELAAVVGYEFSASILAEVLEEKRVEILKRLAALERRYRLVASSGRDSFRFASRPVFDATYDSISEALRAEYHDLIAETIQDGLDGDEPDGATAYNLLRHLLAAERAGDGVPYLETALDHIDKKFHASFAAPFLERVAAALGDASPEHRFAIAMRLWDFYERLANRDDQMRILDHAAALAEEIDEPAARARVHAYRGGSYCLAGDYAQAEKEARAGLELARMAGDRKWESTCLHTLGFVAFRRGELETCREHWREALGIRREIGDRRGEASTLLGLAAIMPAMGEGDRVLETMQQSLEIQREIGDRRGEARMLMNIGAHFVNAARYEEGLGYLELAIAGHRETGARVSEGMTLTNLGHAQHLLGMIDSARSSWKRALGIFVDLGNTNGELMARAMMGSALGEYGEYGEARKQLKTAIELAESTGNKSKLVGAQRELGEILHRTGDAAGAQGAFAQAMAVEAELNDPTSRVLTAGVVARAALDDGEFERAATLLEEILDDARAGDGVEAPLVLCRLARAQLGRGRDDEARAYATEALERVDAGESVSTFDGPEIYYTLYVVLGREDLRDRARELVEQRARPIRNDSYREHFLTRTWPNPDVLAGE